MSVVFALLAGLVLHLVSAALRRAEADAVALRRNEELFRAVVEDQTEMIVRWKPDTTRTFVNQAYCDVFGIKAEDAVGTSFMPLVAEDERERVRLLLASLTPANPVATHVHQSVTLSGERRWQEWTDRAMFDAAGRLVELQSTGTDITARLAAQSALLDSEERYRLLFDGNPLPMIVYELQSLRFQAVNDAAVKQYGYTREELLTMTVGDLAVPGDAHYAEFVAGLGKPRASIIHVGLRRQRLSLVGVRGKDEPGDVLEIVIVHGELARQVAGRRQARARREPAAEDRPAQAAVQLPV
jgi:PAS domain S-box-containing protein